MLKNYFKIAWRNLWKNKSFSAINILGLALGMTCSLFILLWVLDERNMDAFHEKGDRLYTVYNHQFYDGKVTGGYATPGLLADEMKRNIPEVENATSFAWNNFNTFATSEKIIKIEGNCAGEGFFELFSYPLLVGNPKTALNSPVSIAVSRNMANRLFGSPEQAFHKTVRFENQWDLQITAVFENLPNNASEKFDYLVNWHLFLERNGWAKNWGNNGPATFILLKPGVNVAAVQAKVKNFLDKYTHEEGSRTELAIQRYDEKYLYSNFKDGYLSGGRIEYVRLFSIIAIFILIIACINFMNLTTARSVKRAKEIGVRKVVGALRSSLIRQFIGEAILLAILSLVIAILLVIALLPVFNELTGKTIQPPFTNLSFWLSIAGLTVLTGILSGSYPALLLSSFKPVAILKGKLKMGSGTVWFRKGLVVFQFTLSILLIIGMMVISQQVDYIQTKNLGYQKNDLIYIPLDGELPAKFTVFKEETMKLPGIAGITRMSQRPEGIHNFTSGVKWEGKDESTKPEFAHVAVGYDFIKTLHIQLVAGRDFSKDFADSNNYILNEKAVAKIGFKDPIGKSLTQWGKKGQVIGVIKDFHFSTLHEPIEPLVLRLGKEEDNGVVLIRTEPGKTRQALTSLEAEWEKLNPKFPFSHMFADEEYAALYKSEQVIHKLSDYFAFLAIFISCLGLLGLVMFTAEQRTREIGVRKVLGASVGSLFTLLSKDFLVLVGIAFVIASPLAWWAMNSWLQDFEYRVSIQWWIFAVAGIAAICIALLTVSGQAIKAALANPVKSLRSE
jgi:putative ABC transport system permease protein